MAKNPHEFVQIRKNIFVKIFFYQKVLWQTFIQYFLSWAFVSEKFWTKYFLRIHANIAISYEIESYGFWAVFGAVFQNKN